VAVAAVSVVVVAVVSWVRFVDPPGTQHWASGRADAVVMFGGAGPRFEAAVSLVEAGVADTLVVSDPNDPPAAAGRTDFEAFCAGEHPYEAICFDPEPRTTRGESRFLARLAADRHWRHVVLVTTADQASRARMLVDRCWDGSVELVVVDSGANRLARVLYEWGATTRALLFRRSC
jgi:uncharacterized SAM-binding protein YcdF (DUF218 family)